VQARWRVQSSPIEAGYGEHEPVGPHWGTDQAVTFTGDERSRQADSLLILVMRGLRSVAHGLLAVLLGVAFANAGFSPAAIGTVSLVGDLVGTYVIGLVADTWGRLRSWRSAQGWAGRILRTDEKLPGAPASAPGFRHQ
jgi:hypothetical protein